MDVTKLRSVLISLIVTAFIHKVGANTALIIIDVQNCFLPGGSLAVVDGQSVIPVINSIRQKYGRDFTLTVLSQDWHCADHVSFASQHDGKNAYDSIKLQYDNEGKLCNSSCAATYNVTQTLWPDHCVKGTAGANFSTLLNTSDDDIIIRKGFVCQVDSYSAFFDNGGFAQTKLDSILKSHNIDTVVVTGLALDYCVYYTSKDAEKLGYKVYTVLDASRPVSNVTMETALRDLRQHANSADSYRTPHYAESDQSLNWLPMSQIWDRGHQYVKQGVNLIKSTDLANIMTSSGIMMSSVVISSILTSLLSYILTRCMHP